MAKSKRPIINFNVPKAGRITTGRVVGVAVIGGMLAALWYWPERIESLQPHVLKVKTFIRKVIGQVPFS